MLSMDGPQLRTIQEALKALGDKKERLAGALGVSMPELDEYLTGAKPLPTQLFIDTLDIVATNGLRRPKR
jgi:transcriptional regulator with XRE-family HTH domain